MELLMHLSTLGSYFFIAPKRKIFFFIAFFVERVIVLVNDNPFSCNISVAHLQIQEVNTLWKIQYLDRKSIVTQSKGLYNSTLGINQRYYFFTLWHIL